MDVNYIEIEKEKEEDVKKKFMDFFNEFYFNSIYKIRWCMRKKFLSLPFGYAYFSSDNVSITINNKMFKELENKFQEFEIKFNIKLYIHIK